MEKDGEVGVQALDEMTDIQRQEEMSVQSLRVDVNFE